MRLFLVFLALTSLAADESAPRTRIVFGSCLHQDRKQDIWNAMLAERPDLFIFAGDNIYADTKDMAVMRKKYQQLADQPGYQKMRKQCPIVAIWDDHDYGWNDAGAEYPQRDESQQIFLDFFGYPKDSPLRSQKGIHHARYFGPPEKRVQVLLMDTRYHRSPLKKRPGGFIKNVGPYTANMDKSTTMLGEEQWAWLAAELKKPATLRILVSTIQVHSEEHQWEKWMNFPHERERLFRTLRDSKAEGLLIISGDRHHAELSVMDVGLGYPLFDITSSGLNQGFDKWRFPEQNKHRVSVMFTGNNFGAIVIDWDKADPRLKLRLHDEVGEVTIQEQIPLSLLRAGSLKTKNAASAPVRLDGELYDPAKAKELLGKNVAVEMRVADTGANKSGSLVFLNSGDRRKGDNFTVVLDKNAQDQMKAAGIADPKTHFAGKTIRVEGVLSQFQEQIQIIVSDAKKVSSGE